MTSHAFHNQRLLVPKVQLRKHIVSIILIGGVFFYILCFWRVVKATTSSPLERAYRNSSSNSNAQARNGTKLNVTEARLSGLTLYQEKILLSNEKDAMKHLDKFENQKVVHFAILGFGKCGTTTVLRWLGKHSELACHPRELYDFTNTGYQSLVAKLQHWCKTIDCRDKPVGFKNPSAMYNPQLLVPLLLDYFPQTKIIIGIRHPVLWFQSLYNFRIQNSNNYTYFPKPQELLGECPGNPEIAKWGICSVGGAFAIYFRHLGKSLQSTTTNTSTNRMTPFELQMYRSSRMHPQDNLVPITNPVFLYELNQLSDFQRTGVDAVQRSGEFALDLQSFLGLSRPLSVENFHHERPGRSQPDQEERDKYKINICNEEFVSVRTDLMRSAMASSIWIQNYLLPKTPQNGVTISSINFFRHLLQSWMNDPCEGTKTLVEGQKLVALEML